MKNLKKIIALTVTATTIMVSTVPVFATTPTYKSWVPTGTAIDWGKVIESVFNSQFGDEDADEDEVIEEDVDEVITLGTTTITEAKYYHFNYNPIWNKRRLQVRWNVVEGAEYYEVKVTKTDGTSNTYTTSYTSLFVYQDSDDFMTACVRSGKVEVRACTDVDGYENGDWSEAATIKCNSLH